MSHEAALQKRHSLLVKTKQRQHQVNQPERQHSQRRLGYLFLVSFLDKIGNNKLHQVVSFISTWINTAEIKTEPQVNSEHD